MWKIILVVVAITINVVFDIRLFKIMLEFDRSD